MEEIKNKDQRVKEGGLGHLGVRTRGCKGRRHGHRGHHLGLEPRPRGEREGRRRPSSAKGGGGAGLGGTGPEVPPRVWRPRPREEREGCGGAGRRPRGGGARVWGGEEK